MDKREWKHHFRQWLGEFEAYVGALPSTPMSIMEDIQMVYQGQVSSEAFDMVLLTFDLQLRYEDIANFNPRGRGSELLSQLDELKYLRKMIQRRIKLKKGTELKRKG